MISVLEPIMLEVGELILNLFNLNASNPEKLNLQAKKDSSPVTIADVRSSAFLTEKLKSIFNIPVLSEESIVDYNTRRQWESFWLIDPLDGTKEFINGYDDFSVSVALVEGKRPVLGAIYAPRLQELYFGGDRYDFQYKGPKISFKNSQNENKIAVSRFHDSHLTNLYAQYHAMQSPVVIGSALKFGRLALGQFSCYPRFQGSWEWDIAAGHAIVNSVGGQVIDLVTLETPVYNKKNLKNNFFIAKK